MTDPAQNPASAHRSSGGRFVDPGTPRIIEAATSLPLTLEAARAHLRLEAWPGGNPAKPDDLGHPDDPQIIDLIAAAVGEIEGPNGWLNRSIMPRILEVELDVLGPVILPWGPIASIDSVSAQQPAGGWSFMDLDAVEITTDGLAWAMIPARGSSWPSGRAVIRYKAGYEEAGDVPLPELALIRTWLKLRLTDLYANGGTLSRMGEAPFAAHLLDNLRIR